jgi:hypothetical protein
MALNQAISTAEAEAVQKMAERLMNVLADIDDLVTHNSGLAIDWGGQSKPACITEDAAGNIEGLNFSRGQVANAIGTFAAIQTLMGQGHKGNLNLVARPVGKR